MPVMQQSLSFSKPVSLYREYSSLTLNSASTSSTSASGGSRASGGGQFDIPFNYPDYVCKRNTFIDVLIERSPSFEGFFKEREVSSAPGSGVTPAGGDFEDAQVKAKTHDNEHQPDHAHDTAEEDTLSDMPEVPDEFSSDVDEVPQEFASVAFLTVPSSQIPYEPASQGLQQHYGHFRYATGRFMQDGVPVAPAQYHDISTAFAQGAIHESMQCYGAWETHMMASEQNVTQATFHQMHRYDEHATASQQDVMANMHFQMQKYPYANRHLRTDEHGFDELDEDLDEGSLAAMPLSLADALAHPALGTEGMPTVGSTLHYVRKCKPCAFLLKGCESGINCTFCHLCEPGEKKRRRKEKLLARRHNARYRRSLEHVSIEIS